MFVVQQFENLFIIKLLMATFFQKTFVNKYYSNISEPKATRVEKIM